MNFLVPSTGLAGVKRCARAIIAPEGFPDRDTCQTACVATIRELVARGFSNAPPSTPSPLMTRARYQREAPTPRRGFWKLDVGYQIQRHEFGLEILHFSVLFPRVLARSHLGAPRTRGHDSCFGCREFVPAVLSASFSLLRVLLPAFQSGARGTLHSDPQHSHIGRLFELVADAALRRAATGERVGEPAHASSPSLWPEPALLNEEMRRLEAALPPDLEGDVGSDVEEITPWAGQTGEPRQCQCLQGTFLLAGSLAAHPRILLSLKERSSTPGSNRTMGDRFGLTCRESEVAALLAERRSNSEIAFALGISPHTASHHTEQVLAKLGLKSRADVSQRIFGGHQSS
jgi:DNA-binding CsgD family transcriptional regulator